MAARAKVLSLYKSLLRESEKFGAYNYRMYAIRRVKDAFRENKDLKDYDKVKEEYKHGLKNLEIIKRQVVIGHLYSTDQLVIEKSN